MEANLTFGEYMRRLRRGKQWSLHMLADATKLSYHNLSRLENDSTLPRADTVATLAEALGGDLKVMLELADCLPRAILDRMVSGEGADNAPSLRRSAGAGTADSDTVRPESALAQEILESYEIDPALAKSLALTLERLLRLDSRQRDSIIRMIEGFADEETDGSAG
jgi:transcriptional regulator with XRE-family HTH domain